MVVVHRPRYDDWSIPKGKHDPGESSAACAVREVEEETGYACRIVGDAGTTRYRSRGRPKRVYYYLMRPYRAGAFQPDEEVDEIRWVAPAEAVRLLTYDFDREMIERLPPAEALAHTTLHLLRHAPAGDRSRWEGPDVDRPLTTDGHAQAKALAEGLGDVGVSRILTSPYVRCVQSVAPLAESTGRKLELNDDLAEGGGARELDRILEEVAGQTAVVCSHGDIIPALLERLQRMGIRFLSPYRCQKGSTWVLGHDGSRFTEARYVPPPAV